MAKRKGRFIVFEGIDGAGSTTQLNMLHDYLKKKKVPTLKTQEPTDSFIGKLIGEVLRGKHKVDPKAFQLLYCADRENHLSSEIVPALESGKVVLCDRYYYSTIAYGFLKLNYDWLVSICADFPRPDLAFYVDTPVSVAMDRMKNRQHKEFFEREKWLGKVRETYLKLMRSDKRCVILDGTKSREEIFKQVLKTL